MGRISGDGGVGDLDDSSATGDLWERGSRLDPSRHSLVSLGEKGRERICSHMGSRGMSIGGLPKLARGFEPDDGVGEGSVGSCARG